MKGEKGQALVEFILIVPILFMILMGIFDIGNIIYKKYQLENSLDYVVDLYESGSLEDIDIYITQKKISVAYDTNPTYTTITLSRPISFITPGMNRIIGSTYDVEVERTIFNES